MKKMLLILPLIFAISLSNETYWESVQTIEKKIFDPLNLYSVSKDELRKYADEKKCLKEYNKVSINFEKSEEIISKIIPLFEKEFLKDENSFPYNKEKFREWKEDHNQFFVELFNIFKQNRDLSLIEISEPFLKLEIMRTNSKRRLFSSAFPRGFGYNCGRNGEIVFAPSLGFCFSRKDCEECVQNVRLEFFGSKEYIFELSSLRPNQFKEGEYLGFNFDEKGIIIPSWLKE